MSMFRETVAGTELLRRRGFGGGLPLVLLHGIGSDAETWAPLIQALDPAIDVLAWDAPGYGASAAVAPEFPMPDDYAARLGAVLDALALPRVVLAGHSLGSLFAARFALQQQARVARLALMAPALGYGVRPGEALPPAVQARIDDLAALGPAAFAAKRAARLVHGDNPLVLAGVQRAMAAVNIAGYTQAVRALGAGTLLADAAALTQTTLVAVGAEDVVAPPANARALHAALRHALPLRLVPATGHALPQEAPALVAMMLAELTHGG
jgi:pimeloyl-ACP methyl ester carboxylesterase